MNRVCLFACLIGVSHVASAAPLYLAIPSGGASPGGLVALEDKNADGDALDGGERWTFRDGSGLGIPTTQGFFDVAVGQGGRVYAVDMDGSRIFKFEDKDGDGDAQSASEISVVYQSVGLNGTRVAALSVGTIWDENAEVLRDSVYAFDPLGQRIYRYIDWNGDGVIHPEEPAEVRAFHSLSGSQPFTSQRMITAPFDLVYGTLVNDDGVARVWSASGDGALDPVEDVPPTNCPLGEGPDAKEYLLLAQSSATLNQVYGITSRGESLFVSVPPGQGQDVGRIQLIKDRDGDELAFSSGEVKEWARLICSALSPSVLFADPTDLESLGTGAIVVGDMDEGALLWFKDTNGDGDAEDTGECGLFAQGLAGSTGMAIAKAAPVPLTLALSGSALVDAGKGPQLPVPHGGSASFTLETQGQADGLPVSNVPYRCDVLEGCLSCTARIGKTNAAGQATITLTHGGPEPITAGGTIVLTGPSGEKAFMEAVWPIMAVKDEAGSYVSSINLGSVAVGESVSAFLAIHNQGSETLTGEGSISNPIFSLAGSPFEVSDPASPSLLEISASPTTEGPFDGYLTLTGGGGGEVYVYGEATAASGGCETKSLAPAALLLLPLIGWRRRRRST